uniref:Uncharacterized protein n=1 Tax=Vitis vinifera TaxID=29760 RepID=F6HSA1_VITVI
MATNFIKLGLLGDPENSRDIMSKAKTYMQQGGSEKAIYKKETQGIHLYESCNYGLLLLNQYQPSRVSCFMRKIMSGSDHSSGFDQPRLVVKKVLAKPQCEGEGAVVRRSIGRSELKNQDPFLKLDEFTVAPPTNFPNHPY